MEKKLYKKPRFQTAKRYTAPRKRLSESDGDNTCVVCAHSIAIYAVGNCNHFICFKCSTKIRLLCEENLCPVCRKELDKVIFSKKRMTFSELNNLKLIRDKDYDVGIYFADISIIKDYKCILEHRCPVCKDRPPDKTFEQTKAHLRKEHTLFYCDICLEHNRTFTTECKVYSRKDLAVHKRIGDPDDTSHRGHPLCVYCDVRYLDDDKLFHHLRTSHYFCHLCDQGERNEFYGTYDDLRKHFREEHFLCEEGECAKEEFTSVFGSEIDFKAHFASVHKVSRSKQQLKRDRQIDLGFQYSRRESTARGRGQNHPRPSRSIPRHAEADYSNAFERMGDVGKQKIISHEQIKVARSDKNDNTAPDSKNGNSNNHTVFHQADFPQLAVMASTSTDHSVNVINQHNSNKTSKPLWNENSTNNFSKLENEEDFPSLPIQQSSLSYSNTSWNAKNIGKSKKTDKILSQKNSKSSTFSKFQNKTRSSASSFKKDENDFPILNSKTFPPKNSKVSAAASKMTNQAKPQSKNAVQEVEDALCAIDNESNQHKTLTFTGVAPLSMARQEKYSSMPFKENLHDNDDFPILSVSNDCGQNNTNSAVSSSSQQRKSKSLKKNLQNDKDFPKLNTSVSLTKSTKRISKSNLSNSQNTKISSKTNTSTNSSSKHSSSHPFGKEIKTKSTSSERATNDMDNNEHNDKRLSKPVKTFSDENDFPTLNSLNEVLVGRGSSKHIETFESFAEERTPNISLVPSEVLDIRQETSHFPLAEYKHQQNDFPSLPSSGKPFAPPGFSNVNPTPFPLENSFVDKSFGGDGASLFLSNSTGIKPPPGFKSISSFDQNKSLVKKCITDDSFKAKSNDFPSLSTVYPLQENGFAVKFPDELCVAAKGLSVENNLTSAQNSKIFDVPKNTFKGKIAIDQDKEFPSLDSQSFSSPFLESVREQNSQAIASYPDLHKNSNGINLNLANIFDFPSL